MRPYPRYCGVNHNEQKVIRVDPGAEGEEVESEADCRKAQLLGIKAKYGGSWIASSVQSVIFCSRGWLETIDGG